MIRTPAATSAARYQPLAGEPGTASGRFAYPGVNDSVALAAAAGATSRIGLLSHVLRRRPTASAAGGASRVFRPAVSQSRAPRGLGRFERRYGVGRWQKGSSQPIHLPWACSS
jgi:hypothetical protein